MLAATPNPLLSPPPLSIASIESELKRLPHLSADRKITRRTRRDFRDARRCEDATAALGRLPDPDESLHLIVSGKYALWHTVPAAIAIGGPIADLTIATLGFSKKNIAALCEMLDAGQIGTARLLCSHFKGTSAEIYDFAAEQFAGRPNASFLSLRTHAKLLMFRFASGRTVTIESSANLRSCQNIEQMTVIGDPALYEFHRRWIDDLFDEAGRQSQSGIQLDSRRRVGA